MIQFKGKNPCLGEFSKSGSTYGRVSWCKIHGWSAALWINMGFAQCTLGTRVARVTKSNTICKVPNWLRWLRWHPQGFQEENPETAWQTEGASGISQMDSNAGDAAQDVSIMMEIRLLFIHVLRHHQLALMVCKEAATRGPVFSSPLAKSHYRFGLAFYPKFLG